LWPCVPLVTKKAELATAFGLMSAIQNGGLSGINAINGVLQDHFTYTSAEYVF